MAQTRYGDLRDTFCLSRLTNNGLLRHADFSASCWRVSSRAIIYEARSVRASLVWWSQRDLNPCLSLERTDESEENQQDDPSEPSDE